MYASYFCRMSLILLGPGASVQYVELHQCGHVPMEEKPNEFIAAVDAWLATLMPADSTWK